MELNRALFTIAGLHLQRGGPSQSVPNLCRALAQLGLQIEIVSHHYGPEEGTPNVPRHERLRATFVDCSNRLQRRLQWTPEYRRTLRSRCQQDCPQILHDTGLWLSTNRAAAAVAGELGIRRVVSPRGMLSAWALNFKAWKKRIAWALYQHRDLAGAAAIHATSEEEAQEFRAVGLTQPVIVIPNGLEVPPATSVAGQPASGATKRTVLFLSRLHPKKGLLDLVKAWAAVRPAGWQVVIAGPDENGHAAQVKAAARESGVLGDFTFPGAVLGDARWNLFRQADLFVLPSYSENFGIVIAEALACGVPVITTRATPWRELVQQRCGWWIEPGADALGPAIREATALPAVERADMGARGRTLVESKYSLAACATQMRASYAWLLGLAPKPECVLPGGEK